MKSKASAFYHFPPIWVHSNPSIGSRDFDLKILEKEVYRKRLQVGITAKVLLEGMFIFDFSDSELSSKDDTGSSFDDTAQEILKRTSVLNAYLICLYSSILKIQSFGLDKMYISPSDLISMLSIDDTGMGFGNPIVAALALSRYEVSYSAGIPKNFDWRIHARQLTLQLDTIEDSFNSLELILTHTDKNMLTIMSLFLLSCKAFEDHDYNLSLINSWNITENMLSKLWRKYLDSSKTKYENNQKIKFINKDRRDKLEGRDFTASVISEVLSFTNEIPFSLYEKLSHIRKKRNGWVHNMEKVNRNEALTAIQVTQAMIKLVCNIDINVGVSSKLSY